jgi:hypothetical protein
VLSLVSNLYVEAFVPAPHSTKVEFSPVFSADKNEGIPGTGIGIDIVAENE